METRMKVPDTLPWLIDNFRKIDDDLYKALMSKREAEYIITACNLYPEMKEILGKLILAIEAEGKYMYMVEIQESKELEEAKELLNKLGEAHIEEVP